MSALLDWYMGGPRVQYYRSCSYENKKFYIYKKKEGMVHLKPLVGMWSPVITEKEFKNKFEMC